MPSFANSRGGEGGGRGFYFNNQTPSPFSSPITFFFQNNDEMEILFMKAFQTARAPKKKKKKKNAWYPRLLPSQLLSTRLHLPSPQPLVSFLRSLNPSWKRP